ncbi:MAG: aspartate/glutamate racemase family protein [Pseudomonadota bacterium]
MPTRILYQLTSPMHRTLGQGEIDRRREILSTLVAPGTTVAVEPLEEGPPAVESLADITVVGAELVRQVPRWRDGGYDAVVIGCFSDPGLAALRDLIEIPVVGPGASAVHVAAQFGERFGVLSSEPTPKGLHARFRAMGVGDLYVSERMVGCSVLDLSRRRNEVMGGIVEAARACVADGADVLVMGCLGMGFLPGLSGALQDEAGVPVVNPVIAALKTAETAVALGLRSAAR